MDLPHHYVLIVANRTAATPRLLERVRQRALRGGCQFTLLVPALPEGCDAEDEARKTLALAVPLLEDAAGGPVRGIAGPSDPVRAIEEVLAREHFDEVIVSTLPEPVSSWLERDLPGRIERSDVPVAVVTAQAAGE
jgi:hypothetical protein